MNSSAIRSPRRRACFRRHAFTLIELLTVIAIIGILAAIIVPTLGRVRLTARNAECVSNLRQWAQVVNLYAHDNKGSYVIRGKTENGTDQHWAAGVNSFASMHYSRYLPGSLVVEKLRNCPSRTDGISGLSYSINRPYVQGATVSPLDKVPLSRVKAPAHFMLFTDVDLAATSNNGYTIIGPGGLATYVTPMFADAAKDRHHGRANMSFADGHVAAVTQADILAKGDRWTKINND